MNKKLIRFTSLLVLFVILILPGVMLLFVDEIPANSQPGYDGRLSVAVYGEENLVQYFVSKNKNLNALGTSIKNPNLNNKKDIYLELYDSNDNLVRTSKLNGLNIGDGDFVKFFFKPITDSKEKEYHFIVSSPQAGIEDTIKLFLTDPTEQVIKYIYQGDTHMGGIPLVSFHLQSRWVVMKEMYSNWFSRLLW